MDVPKGFACSVCQQEHEFSPYVFAHWRDILTHTCKCGAKHNIIVGRATLQHGEEACVSSTRRKSKSSSN